MSDPGSPPKKSRLFSRPGALTVPSSALGAAAPAPAPALPAARPEPAEEPTIRVPKRAKPGSLAANTAVPVDEAAAPVDEAAAPVDEAAAPVDEAAAVDPAPAAPVAEAAPVDAPPVDEEPTLREVRVGDLLAEPPPVDDVEELEVPRPLEAWERPVVPVRRALAVGRFGGANPAPRADGPPPPPKGLTSVSPATAPTARPARPRAAPAPEPPPPPLPDTASATAPGKIILLGEHAVVFGHRAIAAAVDLGTTVTMRRRPGPSRVEDTPIDDPRLAVALASIVPAEGVGVTIRSTLPVGCGMGSSAALAIATVRAFARLEGREASLRECVDKGFVLERVFHGNPSGLDHTVSASGGALIYRRGEPAEELAIARPIRLVIANTGVPGNTAEMVARVRKRNPTELLTRIGALVEMTAARLARGEPIGEFIREAHRCLRLIGVSTPALDDLCRAMEAAGASGAKLAGAGGGGVAIALVDERAEEAVRRAAAPLAPGGVWTTTIGAAPRGTGG